jgi:hypothetical protein
MYKGLGPYHFVSMGVPASRATCYGQIRGTPAQEVCACTIESSVFRLQVVGVTIELESRISPKSGRLSGYGPSVLDLTIGYGG